MLMQCLHIPDQAWLLQKVEEAKTSLLLYRRAVLHTLDSFARLFLTWRKTNSRDINMIGLVT